MKILIRLDGLQKSYGPQVLFDSASAAFRDDQKLGVIGRNGAGKSTLCRIITGQEEADAGTVWKSDDLRLGVLEQHDPYTEEETIAGFMMRYSGRQDWECGRTAWRFEITNDMMSARIGSLPGGYRTRVKLAAVLVSEPNFLVLDEPSNYLDLKTLILLENFLEDFKGGFLVVSHDREFLKKTCEETLEIENAALTVFPGPVHDYLVFKDEEKQRIDQFNRNLGVKQRQLERFVERFRAQASKARQARSKQKQLDRLNAMTIETDHPLDDVRVRLPSVESRTGLALRIEKLSIGYPERTVASGITLDIDRGRRVAVLGDNGQGKTTFLRTLAGELAGLSGRFAWSYGLAPAYYAQHVFTALDPELDVYSTLRGLASVETKEQDLLDLAGCFLFKGDDVRKKVRVLSGGERSRVCLAGLLLAARPVLLLDEPTNHLDFETVEALGRALRQYRGTILFICHDRTFVSLVADQVLEVRDSRITHYPGTYEEYVYSLEQKVRDEGLGGGAATGRAAKIEDRRSERKSRFEQRKLMVLERRKIVAEMSRCEETQKTLGHERDRLHRSLEEDPVSWTRERAERYETVKRELSVSEDEWLELHRRSEELDAKIAGFDTEQPGDDA